MINENPPLISKYPQGSCPCEGCPSISAPFYISPENPLKIPTNLGVGNCYDNIRCYDKKIYKQNQQPVSVPEQRHLTILNTISPIYSPEYLEVKCDKYGSCPGISYASNDPRLLDPRRNSLLTLDTPPLITSASLADVCRDNIYDKKFKNFDNQIGTYNDIRDGEISYYIDSDISNAYFKPNFTQSSIVDHLLFKDPMGAIKPIYTRKPLVNYTQNPGAKQSNDQYTYDSLYFREGLMAKQMEKRNQQRWEPRWENSPYFIGVEN